MKTRVAFASAFVLGIAASCIAPWTGDETVLMALLQDEPRFRPTAPPPPRDVLEAFRTISHAEESFRDHQRSVGRDAYASLFDLDRLGLVSPEIGSGALGTYRVEVRAKPGLPGPIWIARIGKWVANEHGRLFEIPCDPEGYWW